MHQRFILFAILTFLPVSTIAGQTARQSQSPNIVVIFCDNLGYGDIEPFGSTLHRTPHLNQMAAEGCRFTHFYVSSGVCTPSRASLLTGCYAQRIGMHQNPRDGHVLRPVSAYGLATSETTIAEVLRKAGYATSIFGKWHLGDQPEFLPNNQGFDLFFGIPYSDDMTREVGQRLAERLQGNQWPELPLMRNATVIEAPVDRNLLTKRCTEEACKFIQDNHDRPFFVYFAQPMPGSTAAPFSSPEFRGKSKNGPWGDSIEEIDWSTGQILKTLIKLNIDDNTLVVWLSDNGAPLASDRSSLARGSNLPLHGRGYTTSEGAFRSPTIMRWPGHVKPNSVCSQLATTMDLLPTFAALTGVAPPKEIDGYDIRPLILGSDGATTPYEAFFYYYRDQLQAVRSGDWKLFIPLDTFERHPHFTPANSSKPLLFNVVTDISSEHNVAADHPEIVARLSRLAARAMAELGDHNRTGHGQRPTGKITGKPKPLLLP
ncbi:MAG: sulfatase [Fuerstiella sp.]